MRYTICGAGPGGLYTAWRLVTSGKLGRDDSITMFEWGHYAFVAGDGGTRLPAGRICTHHYKDDPDNSYIEVGGMRFLEWDPSTSAGHQLVTKTIQRLGLVGDIVPFLTTDDPLLFLRGQHFYQSQLGHGVTAPYRVPGYDGKPASDLFTEVSRRLTGENDVRTRSAQCRFYGTGRLSKEISSSVYGPGDLVANVGYWNFFYDQAGSEGFNYANDAGGYSSNVINWNAANAAVYNGEFAPGGAFKTLKTGYSRLFVELFRQTLDAAAKAGIPLELVLGARLHSIWSDGPLTRYRIARAEDPFTPDQHVHEADVVFLAMPRHSVELVADATRGTWMPGGENFLNATPVQDYLHAVITQPSYKVAMFFDRPWWSDAKYPPRLVSTDGTANVFGPTITDLPLRQVYYFGNNATGPNARPVYGILASYDDMRFTGFWRELEVPLDAQRKRPVTQDYQPLEGARAAPESMQRMLLLQLAMLHYGDHDAASRIPHPLETVFVDWGLNPFGAGYHAWAAHYDICDVMQKIRAPAALAGQANKVFLVGSAYSNDQAWVEGAFCTVDSVLEDFLGIPTMADTKEYPLICGTNGA